MGSSPIGGRGNKGITMGQPLLVGHWQMGGPPRRVGLCPPAPRQGLPSANALLVGAPPLLKLTKSEKITEKELVSLKSVE
jgi:hypothetical protein